MAVPQQYLSDVLWLKQAPLQEAIAYYEEVVDASRRAKDLGYLAYLGRQDRVFLLAYLLGRTDALHPWVYERTREVEAAPDGYLDIWSREHYKSTVITYAGAIQEVLNDPDITIGIFSHTRPIAKGFARQIKREFEDNAVLKSCYPDVLYDNPWKQSPMWNEDGFIVKRKGNPKEATIEAWGLIDGQPTGKHYKLRVYDDVVTRESVTTPDMIGKTTDAWALSLNLASEEAGARSWHIGTRYHLNDTYKEVLKREAAVERRYPATEDGEFTGPPVMWTRETLDRKIREMGTWVAACQLMCDPKADAFRGFDREDLRWYKGTVNHASMIKVILVDPANAKTKRSDYTAIAVIGLGMDENYYLLDCVRDRLTLTERTRELFRLHQQYRPLMVGYERYGKDSDIEHIESEMARIAYHFGIEEMGGRLGKTERVDRLMPIVEANRLYLPQQLLRVMNDGRRQDVMEEFLLEEFDPWPVSYHDDLLDAMSRVFDLDPPWPGTASAREKPDPYAQKKRVSFMAR